MIEYKEKLKEGLWYENYIVEKIKKSLLSYGWEVRHITDKDENFEKGDIELTASDGERMYIEVKYDKRMKDTGNLYIEYEELASDGNWYKSSLYRETKVEWWLQGNTEYYYLVKVDELKRALKGCRKVSTKTSRGVVISENDLIEKTMCEKKIMYI